MKELYESFKVWIDLAQWLVTGAVGVVWWQLKRDKSQDTQISDFRAEVAKQIAALHVRQEVVEEKLKHVPSSDETAKLTARIDSLDRSTSALNNNVQRLNDFLLNNR